jgi:hypothetical protein
MSKARLFRVAGTLSSLVALVALSGAGRRFS